MAEALLLQSFAQSAQGRAESNAVRSSGLTALTGEPADPAAVQLMQERGIDITGHRAKQIDTEQINWADLVLVMETVHRDIIQVQVPSSRGKVFRLGHFANADIPDPYRQSKERFAEVLQMIDENVSRWVHETIRSEAASG
jgi:protein-tyrosine phosphatase